MPLTELPIASVGEKLRIVRIKEWAQKTNFNKTQGVVTALVIGLTSIIAAAFALDNLKLAAVGLSLALGLATIVFFTFLYPLLIVSTYLLASTLNPFQELISSFRLPILALGAFYSAILTLRKIGTVAIKLNNFEILWSASVAVVLLSSFESPNPLLTAFKGGSLACLLIFLLGWQRLQTPGWHEKVVAIATVLAELYVWVLSILVYFHVQVYENPNSDGAVLGIFVFPLLFCSLMKNWRDWKWFRRLPAVLIASVLLLQTASRASMLGSAVAFTLACIGMRRFKPFLIGSGIAAVLLFSTPYATNNVSQWLDSLIYKNRAEPIMSTRQDLFEQNLEKIEEHPWLGDGFGTSRGLSEDWRIGLNSADYDRERGNSIATILEGVGFIGAIPFFGILGFLLFDVFRGCLGARKSIPNITLACIVASGVTNAQFEAWLFAVGSMQCVFFWFLAFTLRSSLFGLQHPNPYQIKRPYLPRAIANRTRKRWVTSSRSFAVGKNKSVHD